MTCADFQDRISPMMDGELSHWTRWKVQNHLRQCAECAAMLQDLEAVDLCLAEGLGATPAPEYLTDAVMHRLPAMPPAWRRSGAALTWSAGLAVVGMQLMALGGAYWWGYARGTETGPPTDRSNILSAPNLTPRRVESGEPEERANAGRTMNSGGVWGKPISVINDPAAYSAPVRSKPAKRPEKSTRVPQTFGPRMHLEGAR